MVYLERLIYFVYCVNLLYICMYVYIAGQPIHFTAFPPLWAARLKLPDVQQKLKLVVHYAFSLCVMMSSFTTPESDGPLSRCGRQSDWGSQVEKEEELMKDVQKDMHR